MTVSPAVPQPGGVIDGHGEEVGFGCRPRDQQPSLPHAVEELPGDREQPVAPALQGPGPGVAAGRQDGQLRHDTRFIPSTARSAPTWLAAMPWNVISSHGIGVRHVYDEPDVGCFRFEDAITLC